MNSVVARTKYFVKQVLFGLPGPLGRSVVSAGCAAGLLRLSYQAYYKLNRPNHILSGPFEGMPYIPIAAGSAWMPKLLGTYESELRPAFKKLASEPCDVLVDIGSAEGYYAVGLAKMMGIPKVYGFDTDPSAKDMLLRLAALNGVADQVVARGICCPEELDAILHDSIHPLVITDCEGGEVDVLDPIRAPELKRSRLVIEIHDYFGSDAIGATIRERFACSHRIETVPTAPRLASEFPASHRDGLTEAEKLAALDEGRPPVAGWLLLWPKS